MNSNFDEAFDLARGTYQGGRFSRLLRAPAHLLYSKLIEVKAKATGVPSWQRARTFWGDEMHVVFPEHVSMMIYRYRFYEPRLTQLMLQVLRPGMVFFDVGAHFGYYSLLASTLVGESGQVHSFEPTPSTFEVLRRNTNSKPNIRINNLALWSEPSSLHLRDYGTTHSAFNSIEHDGLEDNMSEGARGRECTIQATSVDQYVRETGKSPNFLKLDAEGAELKIISGMAEILRNARPLLTVEVGDILTHDSGKSRSLLDSVISYGYRPFDLRDGKITAHELRDCYSFDNILLKPVEFGG